ncbi:MAG: hypothetical protein JW976_00195 [Syntrophaceae bacterium]|nr:hypothetical protein [Syntrophaceae bacterium]
MRLWQNDFNELKIGLEKLGWRSVKDEATGLDEWYSQGVLYSNFTKQGRVIHIEYGDKETVFGG